MRQHRGNWLRRLGAAMLCAAMAASALAGCAAPSGEQSGSPQESDRGSAGETNVLKIVQADKITGLDMFQVSNNGAKVSMYWGDCLFDSDHEGTYGPCLATDWAWSDDYLTLTVNLRDDVYFTNGEKLTASDVAFTYNRILTDSDLANYRFRDNLTEVEAVDEATAIFHFFKPMASFFNDATRTPILCQSAYESDPEGYFDKPVGSGAFALDYFDPSTGEVRFVRNEDWWGWGVMGEKTNVDQVEFYCMPDATTRVSSLRSGEYDVVEDITLDMVDTVKSEGFDVQTYYQQRHYFMAVNCAEGHVFSDPNLREAFSLCLDRQLIVDTIVGGGHVSDWVRPPMYLDYNENSAGYPYDPDRARALIDASNYNGEEIELLLGDGVMSRGSEIIQAIQAMASEVGFNVNPQILENTTVVDRRFAGQYDLAFAGFTGTNGENLNEVLELFGSKDRFKTGYVDEKQFAMIEEAAGIVDETERAKALIEAEQLAFESNAYIYLYEPLIACGVKARVENLKLNSDGYQDLRFARVAE